MGVVNVEGLTTKTLFHGELHRLYLPVHSFGFEGLANGTLWTKSGPRPIFFFCPTQWNRNIIIKLYIYYYIPCLLCPPYENDHLAFTEFPSPRDQLPTQLQLIHNQPQCKQRDLPDHFCFFAALKNRIPTCICRALCKTGSKALQFNGWLWSEHTENNLYATS